MFAKPKTSIFQNIHGVFTKSIKNKMIIIITICMLIPLTVVTIFSFYSSSNSMEKEIIKSNSKSIEWSSKFINKTITQLNDVLFTFLVDLDVYRIIHNSDDINANMQYNSQSYIQNKLTSIYYSNNCFNGLIFYIDRKHQLFYASNELKTTFFNYKPDNQNWYIASKKSYGGVFINNDKLLPNKLIFSDEKKEKSFFVVKSIREFENKEYIGAVLLNVKWSIMDDILSTLKTDDQSDIIIANTNGTIAYNPFDSNISEAKLGEIVDLIKKTSLNNTYIKSKDYSIFYSRIANNELLAMKIIPNALIDKSAKNTLKISILIILLSLLICVLISITVTYEATKPIIRLSKAMKGNKENQLISFSPSGRQDEIGVLEQSYAFMIQRIKDFIENEYRIKMEKRTAQLKALQTQINPHFLNNTLQLIGGIAISKDIPEIYTITKAISNIYFYSNKIPNELVELKQELQHVKDYLIIQQLRFSDKLEVVFNFDEELMEFKVPKLIIQPIVENAFKHGLEKKIGIWQLNISVIKLVDNVNIIVEDNGIGIETSKLISLNKQLEENLSNVLDTSESIGVKNVDARIKLHYGNEFGLVINSIEGAYTKVILVFPFLNNLEEK